MPTPGQRHHKDPRLAQLTCFWIDHLSGVAKVDLPFLSRPSFHSHCDIGRGRFQIAYEAVHRGIATTVSLLFQPFVDRRDLCPSLAQLDHHLPVWLYRRRVLRRRRIIQCLSQQLMQITQRRQRPRQQALFDSPSMVAGHRLAIDAQVLGNRAVALSLLKPSQHFSNIHGLFPLSRHSSSRSLWSENRKYARDGGVPPVRSWPSLAENEWTTFGENRWTSLGENKWTSLGENTWPSIARKMTLALCQTGVEICLCRLLVSSIKFSANRKTQSLPPNPERWIK